MKWLNSLSATPNLNEIKGHQKWSALIPAAGRGSRLGYSGPKILYPIQNKPILHWMLESLQNLVEEVVLVLDPHAVALVQSQLPVSRLKVKIAIQPEPIGMADAIFRGLQLIDTPRLWIIWGDQPFFRKNKLQALSSIMELESLSGLIPLIKKNKPYVHYHINEHSRLIQVFQKRELEPVPDQGLSDLGCFAFQTEALQSVLEKSNRQKSNITQEWNFLPEIPHLEHHACGLGFSLFEANAPEAISINNPDEAQHAEIWLTQFPRWNQEGGLTP